MAKSFGGIWPEALLTMIIAIYLQEQDMLVFQSITLETRMLEKEISKSSYTNGSCYEEDLSYNGKTYVSHEVKVKDISGGDENAVSIKKEEMKQEGRKESASCCVA